MKNLQKIEKIQKAFSFSELLILQDLISKERHRIGSSFDILTDQLEKEFKTISDLNTKLKNAINN